LCNSKAEDRHFILWLATAQRQADRAWLKHQAI